MSVKVKDLLQQEIESQIEALDSMEYGSETHHTGVEDTVKLLDKLNDMNRMEQERELKEKEIASEKKDRLLKHILAGGTFLIGTGVTIWANVKSMNFEQGFTHTTEAGRTSTRKLLGFLDKFK